MSSFFQTNVSNTYSFLSLNLRKTFGISCILAKFFRKKLFLATYIHQRGRMCFKSTYDAKVRPLDHSLLVETREMEIFSLYQTYILYYIIYTHNTNVCTFSPMLCKSHRFKFSCSALISHSIIAAKAAADRRCRCHDYCCRAVCFYIIVSLFLCLCVCVCVYST